MNSLNFEGKGFELIKIRFVKFITSIITLGLLYPWGKIRELRYLYNNTRYEGVPFSFGGTMRDYFKGFIKLWLSIILVLILCAGGAILVVYFIKSPFANIIYASTVLGCTMLAFYIQGITFNGTLLYRMNNTTWGTVGLSYTGKTRELGSLFLRNSFLTYLTLGLYTPWFIEKTIKYILNNFRFGNLTFEFSGEPKKLFIIYLKGCIFSILTLGIYSIWFTRNVYGFLVDNITMKKGDQEVKLITDANPLQVFELVVGNFLIVLFTLGIGYSWAKVRLLRFITDHSIIPEGIIPEIVEPDSEMAGQYKKNFLDFIA